MQWLRQGAHVMLIDPFPPTPRDPNGIHATVWKELTGKSSPPQDKPLTIASYVALGGNMFKSDVAPLAVGSCLSETDDNPFTDSLEQIRTVSIKLLIERML